MRLKKASKSSAKGSILIQHQANKKKVKENTEKKKKNEENNVGKKHHTKPAGSRKTWLCAEQIGHRRRPQQLPKIMLEGVQPKKRKLTRFMYGYIVLLVYPAFTGSVGYSYHLHKFFLFFGNYILFLLICLFVCGDSDVHFFYSSIFLTFFLLKTLSIISC